MRVALIHAPFHHRKFSENLKVVDEEFTLSPPIVLAYVASILEKAGHEVILVDAHVLNLSKEETLKKIEKYNPDILGFRLDTYSFQETLEWIRFFKVKTGKPILGGGINFSIYPRETMSHREIDYGLIGEAIETLPVFLNYFPDTGRYPFVPGLCWRDKDGKTIINPVSGRRVSFDDYPFPARHLLPNYLYHSFVSQRKNFTIMLASTGCPYRCKFCAIAALKHWRQRSAEKVIREIEQCYYDYGIREIDFFDATFFADRRWSLEFCERLSRLKLDIVWTARSRVDVVDEEVLMKASKAGCRMIFWGIESVSPEVLNNIKKDIHPEQTVKAVKMAKRFGIRNLGFLMVGNPGDDEKSVKKTVDFAKHLDLDYVQICRTVPKPATELHKELVRKSGRDYWRDFVLLKSPGRRIPALPAGMSQSEVEKCLKKAYFNFYFRPSYILRIISRVRSLAELFRYSVVGLKMLLNYFVSDVEANVPATAKKTYTETGGKKIFVVIPSYNEKENVVELMKKIICAYPEANIIIVDSSDDETVDEIGRFASLYPQVTVLHSEKTMSGNERGRAVRVGFGEALRRGADLIVEMDADLSHNPRHLSELVAAASDSDIIIGSRYIHFGGEIGRSFVRIFLGYLANLYVKYSLGIKDVYDCTSGYRCFRRESLEKIGLEYLRSIEGTETLIEMLYWGIKKGLKVKEVPILYLERQFGHSKFSLSTVLMSLKRVWDLRRSGA